MSHFKERTDKICLNCNAALHGTFCHICGQENIEPKESAWHLVTHFFNDITHFDGKFFSSLKLLVTRPGFLSTEYYRGRRTSYLNPIRMYVFTSAIFFLIFFSLYNVTDKKNADAIITDDSSVKVAGKTLREMRLLTPDSLKKFTAKINNGKPISSDGLQIYFDSIDNINGFHFTSSKYKSKQEYDAILQKGIKKHNWLERKLIYKEIEANEKYHNSRSQFLAAFIGVFIHRFPQMLFISLPFFALLLKLLYIRRKQYYYVSHGIFGIHFYVFIFIVLLLLLGFGALKNLTHWQWVIYLQQFLGIAILFYLYKSMRNFYQQGRAKTLLKFLLLSMLSVYLIAFLFIIFFLFSFINF